MTGSSAFSDPAVRPVKVGGEIVFSCRDTYGEILITDRAGIRNLYFGNSVLQTSMSLDHPHLLLTDYNRAMMSVLIFCRRPKSVLLIGLGGGSIIHFLRRACPGCSIEAVEIRSQVIELAREYFLVPGDSSDLSVVCADGADYLVQTAKAEQRYDLIILDAFGDAGPAFSLMRRDFFHACYGRLSDDGLLVVNAWNRPKDNFPALCEAVRHAFAGSALKMLVGESYTNAIVLGARNGTLFDNLSAYRPAAREMQKAFAINFPRYLKYLYWQNFTS